VSLAFLVVVTDGFAFAIRIGREVHTFHLLGGVFQLRDKFLLAFDYLVMRLEIRFHIHREVAFREIFNMTERSLHYELLAQVFVDGLRLRRRFHDYQSFCHIL
jgi:hypothetical protein